MCWAQLPKRAIDRIVDKALACTLAACLPQLLEEAADKLVDWASACRVSGIVKHIRSFSLECLW
jgi:hypothetical protein